MPHKRNRRNLGAGAGPPLGIRGTSSRRTWGAAHLAASGGIMSFKGALQRDFKRSWDFVQTRVVGVVNKSSLDPLYCEKKFS